VKKLAGLIVGAIALLVVSATPARAQYWVSGAFSVQDWNSDWDGSKGFAVDFGGVIHKTAKTAGALYVDFSYNTFTDIENDLGVVGGFREIFMVNQYFNPYVHASTGLMHWSEPDFDFSGNDWTIGGGGGVMVNLTESFGVKVQYDFWKPLESGEWNGSISRWTFGATYMWGGSR
jgi:hypothetical protein